MCSLDFNVIANWALVFGLGRPSAPFLLNLKWPSPNSSPYKASNKLLDKGFKVCVEPAVNLPLLSLAINKLLKHKKITLLQLNISIDYKKNTNKHR